MSIFRCNWCRGRLLPGVSHRCPHPANDTVAARLVLLEAVVTALLEVRAAEKEEDDLRERMRNLPWTEHRALVDDFMLPNNDRQAVASLALDTALAALGGPAST